MSFHPACNRDTLETLTVLSRNYMKLKINICNRKLYSMSGTRAWHLCVHNALLYIQIQTHVNHRPGLHPPKMIRSCTTAARPNSIKSINDNTVNHRVGKSGTVMHSSPHYIFIFCWWNWYFNVLPVSVGWVLHLRTLVWTQVHNNTQFSLLDLDCNHLRALFV